MRNNPQAERAAGMRWKHTDVTELPANESLVVQQGRRCQRVDPVLVPQQVDQARVQRGLENGQV